jgi:hypothetical protein
MSKESAFKPRGYNPERVLAMCLNRAKRQLREIESQPESSAKQISMSRIQKSIADLEQG